MPTSIPKVFLARYHYDPLDRLIDSTPFDQSAIRRYYCKTRLATETQGSVQRSIVQHDDQLLAQQQREGDKMAATLLATDLQRSILNALDASQPHSFTYTPYGHRPMENGLLSLLGFNGERPDPVTGHYHLGNGYRQFNPVLMRFNSPDSWSPFGAGGLNAYAYCSGDPVNRLDPNGHNFFLIAVEKFLNLIGRSRTTISNAASTGRTLTSGTTNMILQGNLSKSSTTISANTTRNMYRNPMANAAETSYLKLQKNTVTDKPVLPSYEEAMSTATNNSMAPPDYSLPSSISDAEAMWFSREAPPDYLDLPPPRYLSSEQTNIRTSRVTRPTGPPPPVPDRPPETLRPFSSNTRGRLPR